MVICYLDALKKSSKKKEMGIEKEIVKLRCYNMLVIVERRQESKRLE